MDMNSDDLLFHDREGLPRPSCLGAGDWTPQSSDDAHADEDDDV